eukprot:TRINITY_DN18832_c0_g1_i1.p1 TRINITY_DN18832_c0_g1~~TRINITY_DN18832_c0_g1_i1.p1  ORF type:complete len:105 (-),score=9.11 TRINITY_DN18832_c0_g1_i1:897-1211(-)
MMLHLVRHLEAQRSWRLLKRPLPRGCVGTPSCAGRGKPALESDGHAERDGGKRRSNARLMLFRLVRGGGLRRSSDGDGGDRRQRGDWEFNSATASSIAASLAAA